MTLNRQYGQYAKYYLDEIVNIKSNSLKKGIILLKIISLVWTMQFHISM